jgi:hypothetical protein
LLYSVIKSIIGLKKRKYHIIVARILLICFVAGQYMVYAHQHTISVNTIKVYGTAKGQPRQVVTEKCSLCDVMHHNTMVNTAQVYSTPVVISTHFYKVFNYTFTSIQLILSGGRAPPCSCLFLIETQSRAA